ncbi:MAG: hypothetical protein J0L75_17650, partial [Spirochaetes bacterium]|nr:hypothetical protein [Spirochaetota bacterium]
MEYRTFTAPTQKEAREMVLREMGTKAYIIKWTKRNHRKWFGLRNEVEWEVQVGLSGERAPERRPAPEAKPASFEADRREKIGALTRALDSKTRVSQPKPRAPVPFRPQNELQRLTSEILRFAEEEPSPMLPGLGDAATAPASTAR